MNLTNPRSKRVKGRYLYEIAPGRWVTRQCVAQYRRIAGELCRACGQKAVTSQFCERHRRIFNVRQNPKQRSRNQRRRRRGLCVRCGRRSGMYWYCTAHRREFAAYQNAWRTARKGTK